MAGITEDINLTPEQMAYAEATIRHETILDTARRIAELPPKSMIDGGYGKKLDGGWVNLLGGWITWLPPEYSQAKILYILRMNKISFSKIRKIEKAERKNWTKRGFRK